MIRIAIVLALIWAVLKLYLRWKMPAGDARRTQVNARKTVRCALCGVYLAAADAVSEGDRTYCSEEHKRDAAHP